MTCDEPSGLTTAELTEAATAVDLAGTAPRAGLTIGADRFSRRLPAPVTVVSGRIGPHTPGRDHPRLTSAVSATTDVADPARTEVPTP